MPISQCHVFVSSPCGGTAAVAQAVAAGMSVPVITHNVTLSAEPVRLGKEDVAVFAGPVYAGKIPPWALEALANASGSDTPAVLIAVYGNREFEEGLFDLNSMAMKNGFIPIAAIAGVAEHSMFSSVATGRPDATDKKALADFGRQIAEKLAGSATRLEDIPGIHIEPKPAPKEVFAPTTDDAKCTRCGKCAPACPGKAIPQDAPNTTDISRCVGCQACIHICPECARYLGHPVIPDVKKRLEGLCAERKQSELWV